MMEVKPKTLAEKAMLVKLTQSLPRQTVSVHNIQDEVRKLKGDKGLMVSVRLFINSANPIRKGFSLEGARYREHIRWTMPFTDRADRLLPAVGAYERYIDTQRSIEAEVDKWKHEVLADAATYNKYVLMDYEDRIAEAQAQGKDSSASLSDYDSYDTFVSSMKTTTRFSVLPTAKHPLFDANDEELADMQNALRQEIESREKVILKQITDDLHDRMRTPLLKLVDKLKVPIDNKDGGHIFRDSALANIVEACREVEVLCMGDPVVLQAVQDVRSAVISYARNPDVLRQSPPVRDEAAKKLQEVADKIGFMFANG